MTKYWPRAAAVVVVSALGIGLGASALASTSTSSGHGKRTLRQRRAVPPLAAARPAGDHHTDPQGDSGTTPDVTTVDVGNDVVTGPIVIWVTTANRTSWQAGDELITYLDTDLNSQTGSEGVDFVVDHISADTCALYRWNGSDFVQTPAPSLHCRFVTREKAVRLEIQPAELGGTRAMNFFFVTFSGETRGDDAPDGTGIYTYSLISGPLKLSIDDFATIPRVPRAGGVLAAAISVTREDINEFVDSGTIACSLKLGSRSIRGLGRFVQGTPACVWRLPAWTKGKRVRGSITLTFGGTSVSKAFTANVR